MKQGLQQKYIKILSPFYILGLVKSMLWLNLKLTMNMKTLPSFALRCVSSLKEKKKLFIRRKVQLNSEIFNVIWKAFFLQDHNNDLLIYKGLCFRGSQNFP